MILVTGGTGLVGSHLLAHLIQNGNSVKATYRSGSNLDRVEKVFNYYHKNGSELFRKIEWVEADLTDVPALENAFEQIEWVYHAAAYISFDPKQYDLLLKTNVEGTANIVNLCIVNKVKKLCYVSTIGTIGKSLNTEVANEENEWNDQHVNVYALAKYEAEMEVWRGTQEGLPAVMVNPGVIIGPGFWEAGSGTLFTTANKGYKFYPPGGTGFITVHDVVRIMVTLMDSQIQNERFITVAENLTFKEILLKLSSSLNKKSPKIQVKYWQLEILRVGDVLKSAFTGKKRSLTKKSIHSMKHRDAYSSDKIKEFINFEFESLDPTIEYSCSHFLKENL
jgi:nucleoside-diphosphate-sugar epimerase